MEWIKHGGIEFKFAEDEGFPTHTFYEQERTEHSVLRKFNDYEEFGDLIPEIELKKDQHIPYLVRGLERLSSSYECLDASKPWLCYWIVHSLKLLNYPIPDEVKSRTCKFLAKCQSPTGGFCGGPGQLAHLAPTYAAVNCLCSLASEEAYSVIDREKLLNFLWRMRHEDGSFSMHKGGESDTRSVYCASSVASLTGILNKTPELFANSPQWIVSCQTYEGGICGYPGTEAHGGYTFCGYAALVILGHYKLIDTDRLLRWAVHRQMKVEGGFQGRTNKLVDGCYSFWQGGLFPLLHNTLVKEGGKQGTVAENQLGWLFNEVALQTYVLICCQSSFGGLIDKPGKSPDYYHTCYCLSGLSTAQHSFRNNLVNIGPSSNILIPTHPAFNITLDSVAQAMEYFQKL